jgi:REJ domain
LFLFRLSLIVLFDALSTAMVSSSSKLSLSGTVTPNTNVTYLWTETTGQLDLDNRDDLLTSRTNINLVIKANVLSPGATYSFVLQATNQNGTGSAGVGIFFNDLNIINKLNTYNSLTK